MRSPNIKFSSNKKIRVLTAMPGLDCHDRGIIYITNILREAGMEVIYLGPFNTPEMIVKTAIEEDVDVIALSYLNDHLYMLFFPEVVRLLRESEAGDIRVVVGGRILDEDIPKLKETGMSGFFKQGATAEEIIEHIMGMVDVEKEMKEDG